MQPEKALICRIFEQAIEDYRYMNKNNLSGVKDNTSGCYSVKDIEVFFNSKWCSRLLAMIDVELTGEDILNILKSEKVQGAFV